MKDKLTGVGEKIKTFFEKMSKKNRTFLAVALVIILVGSVAIAVMLNNKPYVTLFTGLTSEETQTVVGYLNKNGVANYRLEGDDTILVPKGQEALLKAKLLMEGIPESGFSYSTYFDHIGTMSTESERNASLLFELQDRMAAVIRCLDGVKDAKVMIVQAEDRRYILDSQNIVQATASVIVEMNDGQKLSKQQAAAISNLVARAVKGLEISNIAISDNLGNTYSGADGTFTTGDASQLKLELEEQINNKVRTEIMQVLAPLFGAENVRVSVNSTVDVNRSVGESTQYTTPDGATQGEGIIGSKVFEQEVIRGGDGAAGGVVGTQGNSDINNYVDNQLNTVGTDDTYIKNSGTNDYNVNTNKEQVERVAGRVADLMVSVSINSTATGSINTQELTSHVARAAGIDTAVQGEKISILTAPFYVGETPVTPDNTLDLIQLPPWAIYAAIGGGLLLLFLLVLIAVLRKRARKKKARGLEAMLGRVPNMESAIDALSPEGTDIMNIRTEKSMELRKGIRQFAESNPEIAAQMVKSWLKGGEDANA